MGFADERLRSWQIALSPIVNDMAANHRTETRYLPNSGWLLVAVAVVLLCVAQDALTIWQFPIPTDPSIVIHLTRTNCFVSCPVYSLSLYDNGTAVFEGAENVSAIGPWRTRVDPRRVAELARRIERGGFLDNQYEDSRQVFDVPEAVVSAKIGSRENTARHFVRPADALFTSLQDLEEDIDATADTARWIGNGLPTRVGYSAFFWLLTAMPILSALAITGLGKRVGRNLVGLAVGLLTGIVVWIVCRTLALSGLFIDPLKLWDPLGAASYAVGVFLCARMVWQRQR